MVDKSFDETGIRVGGERPPLKQPIDLTDNARTVLTRRYLRKGPDGEPVENEEEMFWRVAWNVAAPEGEGQQAAAEDFFHMLTARRFFPNSPTFTGAGTPLGQLAACFVLAIDDDMGRTGEGIFQTLHHAALIQQTGGGNGFAFSRLRPRGALVKSSNGQATGPIGFLRVYDQAFGEIAQGGCLTPETLVHTAEGTLRLDEIVTHAQPGWVSHDATVATDEGPRHSAEGYNNGVVPVLRVTTSEGVTLTGTPNHKFKVMTASGPVWKQAEDLEPGDSLIVQLGQHTGRVQFLDLPQQQHGNQIMPCFPVELTEDLAFFLGVMTGDGFVSSGERDHRIGITVAHSSYLIDELPALFARLFGEDVTLHTQQKANDASLTFVADNRAIKDFLLLNGFGKPASTQVTVPRLVRQSPAPVLGAYLRGLFEADGTLSHGYPQLLSTSEALVREVATLLIGLGCPAVIRQQPHDEDRFGSTPVWAVTVSSHVGLAAWLAMVGVEQHSRFSAVADFEPDLMRETGYVLPHASYWVEPVLDAITLPQIDPQGRGQGINFRASEPRLRKRLLRYLRGDRSLTMSGYVRLSESYSDFAESARPVDGRWFVTVESVEEAGEALTLDMEVAGNHTYIANGVVTHNSRRGANMGVLRVDHPDITDFITCKTSEDAITNFNISVGISDAFMQAVRDDTPYDLIDPNTGEVWETVNARDVFDKIVTQAHHNGEPGMLFLDTANKDNPVPHLYALEATNPCLAGDTRIATEFGLLTIAELAEMNTPLFITTDNRTALDGDEPGTQTGVALRPSTPAWLTKRDAPVMTLTTKQGYTLTATPDHRILTTAGYVELQDLKPGDQVLLQSGEGTWSREYALPNVTAVREAAAAMAPSGDHAAGQTVQRSDFAALYENTPTEWSHDLGLAVGWLIGDGWITRSSSSPLGMVFASNETMQRVHEPLSEWFGDGHTHDRGSHYQVRYGRLPALLFETLGVLPVRAHEKRVPESIWAAPREAVVGFLQGLFTADGSVQVNEADCTVRLASGSRDLLQGVQTLLANFGIVGRIYQRRTAGPKLMPDGSGGHAEYDDQAQFELVLGEVNRDRFAELIGFLDSAKQARLEAFIAGKARPSKRETFVDAVLTVEDAGTADVYDLSQPQTVSMIGNAIVVHNCGEQFLGPYENCCLGSVNLAAHVEDGKVDWQQLQETVELATRFLDDVVDANSYVDEIPQLRAAAERVRRIGLGIMGLADMMYALGVRYGSEEGQEFAAQVMEFIHYHAMRTSVELAEERGPFLAYRGSLFDPNNLKWRPPEPLNPYTRDWGRPTVDWAAVEAGVRQHGIRNGAQTTIAPTGTISTVAGVEGYGCEPVFALAYVRYFDDNGVRRQLQYTSPLFEQALIDAGVDEETRRTIVEEVNVSGSVQHIDAVPEEVRRVFVVASDITAEEHVRMQAALQRFVSNAISKTCNFPETATTQDVAQAFQLAWKLGCKGLTVYVAGSREKVVLETKKTAQKREGKPEAAAAEAKTAQKPVAQPSLFPAEPKKPRPQVLNGFTYRVETPAGTAYITVNENGGNQPFEVFINTAKAGSETAAVSEAMGRLISYILRIRSDVPPRERVAEVARQLSGIGGMRPLGLGPNRIRSLPDGLAQMLEEYLDNADEVARRTAYEGRSTERTLDEPQNGTVSIEQAPRNQMRMQIGDLCPECGEAAVVNEEGCRKCYSCGYSEC